MRQKRDTIFNVENPQREKSIGVNKSKKSLYDKGIQQESTKQQS